MRRAYGCANYRFASKSCLFDVVRVPFSSLSPREREQKGPFYASAAEPFGDPASLLVMGSFLLCHRGLTNGDTSPQAPWKIKDSGLRVRGASSRCCRSSGKVAGSRDTQAQCRLKVIWDAIQFSDLVWIKAGHLMHVQAKRGGLDDQIGAASQRRGRHSDWVGHSCRMRAWRLTPSGLGLERPTVDCFLANN